MLDIRTALCTLRLYVCDGWLICLCRSYSGGRQQLGNVTATLRVFNSNGALLKMAKIFRPEVRVRTMFLHPTKN